jgi:hypothetical protein
VDDALGLYKPTLTAAKKDVLYWDGDEQRVR